MFWTRVLHWGKHLYTADFHFHDQQQRQQLQRCFCWLLSLFPLVFIPPLVIRPHCPPVPTSPLPTLGGNLLYTSSTFVYPVFDPSLHPAFESVSYFPSKSTLTSSCSACWATSPPDVTSPQLLKPYASCLSLPTADRDDPADKASESAHYRGRP
jgi:hypothetical protein